MSRVGGDCKRGFGSRKIREIHEEKIRGGTDSVFTQTGA